MGRGKYINLNEEQYELLEDVIIEIKQATEMSEIYLNILNGTMDAFASIISNNLNIVMKITQKFIRRNKLWISQSIINRGVMNDNN